MVVLLLLAPIICSADDNGDWELKVETGIEGQITDICKASLTQEFKWRDDISEFYSSGTTIGLSFKVRDWLSIKPDYKQIYQLKKENGKGNTDQG